jgi:hypothetical protein
MCDPFLRPSPPWKKELDDELRKKDTVPPFGCIFMYLSLGLYIQGLFLVIVGTLLFQWAQALTVNYPGLWTLGTFDAKKKELEYK